MLCRNVKYHFGKMVWMAVAGKYIKPFPFRKLWQTAFEIVEQQACVLRFRQECAVMDISVPITSLRKLKCLDFSTPPGGLSVRIFAENGKTRCLMI